MLKNWKELWNNGRAAGAALAKANPKMVAGFQALNAGQNGNEVLDRKTRELIALAVAVTTRCESCIATHAKAAREAGVTEAELADALGTAITLNAGAAYAFSFRALEAFQQFESNT